MSMDDLQRQAMYLNLAGLKTRHGGFYSCCTGTANSFFTTTAPS
ncbi:hypothetical protein C4K35_2267 [Pseudomonas chlororaphis subsp. piscium]|nr:hypothetical protein C4K35_2267 [Pseudomonas chlororaphis subsp. piscium]AZC62647.1 hypothetical protein C4K33_2155 [Pseudomonas chlororaphis subsp. piscium]AZC68880.1 hypothetical protein C4K32_2218 [Pseudomonas chlororaphis subsp. piscium]AZC75067.1 hypothetical protein C4K31_2164 [Pseudomonas chlororaphis subsp. piscium]AZC88528.1 hypothetical protein C4K29_2227 [Pseudomonas chlororaphis subsp. piscium]